MSIANISSEDGRSGDKDAYFEINLKKAVTKCVGMQLLNAAIPLTYRVINKNTDNFHIFHHATNVRIDLESYFSDHKEVRLNHGTYNIDDLCLELEERINGETRNLTQRQLHIENGTGILNTDFRDRSTYVGSGGNNGIPGRLTHVAIDRLEPGMIIYASQDGSELASIKRIEHVVPYVRTYTGISPGGVGKASQCVVKTFICDQNDPVGDDEGLSQGHDYWASKPLMEDSADKPGGYIESLYWPGVLIYYDEQLDSVIITANGNSGVTGDKDFRHFHIRQDNTQLTEEWNEANPSGFTNSVRMLKCFGFSGNESSFEAGGIFQTVPGMLLSGNYGNGGYMPHTIQKFKNFGSVLIGTNSPEPQGPSMLYLRIGGDALLDQQNSETSFNDRIPIPINANHKEIVHYENDSQADVIPFSVPCDVKKMTFRLEYGDTGGGNDPDDESVVGGIEDQLRGHHVYFRIKFYKQHPPKGQ